MHRTDCTEAAVHSTGSRSANGVSRRGFLSTGGVLAVGAATVPLVTACSPTAQRLEADDNRQKAHGYRTKLFLLGTSAGPPPVTGRLGICSALVIDDRTYIVDLGRGCLDQIFRAGLPFSSIQDIYITHLHTDHIAELYNLFWLKWGPKSALLDTISQTIDVWGPGRAGGLPVPFPPSRRVPTVNPDNPTPGLTDFVSSAIAATAYDINIRIRDQGNFDIHDVIRPHDIALPDVKASPTGDIAPPMEPFPVMENADVKVSAILVRHTPVFPSFAFRFDTADGSVVFSGDTTVTPNMVTLAKGADVLVHEAIDLDFLTGRQIPPALRAHLENSHTDVTKVGGIAQAAGVKTLVLSHLVPGGTNTVSEATWRRKAQQGFSGELVVGHDLMEIGVRRSA